MRFTEYNEETQLYELIYVDIINCVQKLGIIEDLLEEYGILSIRELKEFLDCD